MEDQPPAAQEYKWERETSFFGIHPSCYTEDMRNCVEDYACNGMDALEKALTREPELSSDEMKKLVCEGVDKLYDYMASRFQDPQDKFEAYMMRNIFHIPQDVILPEELPQSVPDHSGVNEIELSSQIRDYQMKLVAAHVVNESLKQELRTVDEELEQYNAIASSIGLDTHMIDSTLLECQVQEVNSYMEELKELRREFLNSSFGSSLGSTSEGVPTGKPHVSINSDLLAKFAQSLQ